MLRKNTVRADVAKFFTKTFFFSNPNDDYSKVATLFFSIPTRYKLLDWLLIIGTLFCHAEEKQRKSL